MKFTMTETCRCGASLTVDLRAFDVRDMSDPGPVFAAWRNTHRCTHQIARADAGAARHTTGEMGGAA